jgi:outer membrane protein OmpA-like peptidoglycan-associated protein
MQQTIRHFMLGASVLLGGALASTAAIAQDKLALQQAPPAQASAKAPDALDLYFDSNSSKIRPQDVALLDKASRLYSEGKPIVMVVAGSADQVGSPALNLKLSQARADNVVRGLVERGIPVERFQVLAKGVSELPVTTAANVVEPRNRRVEITWR